MSGIDRHIQKDPSCCPSDAWASRAALRSPARVRVSDYINVWSEIQQYQQTIARGRTGLVIAYLRCIFRKRGWTGRDVIQDAALFEGLLRARIFEQSLHGLLSVSSDAIEQYAAYASKAMWRLLADDRK